MMVETQLLKGLGIRGRLVVTALLVFLLAGLISACGAIRLPVIGKAGKYGRGKELLLRPGALGANEAIPLLEDLAQTDPTYEDVLTYLGKAYYVKGRYRDAHQVLQRAVVVDKEDELAWLLLGLSQLRLGDDQRGLESFKAGLILFNKKSQAGYRGHLMWDLNGLVRSSIRRAVFQVQKQGLDRKDQLIRAGELIIRRMDDEELHLAGDRAVEELDRVQ